MAPIAVGHRKVTRDSLVIVFLRVPVSTPDAPGTPREGLLYRPVAAPDSGAVPQRRRAASPGRARTSVERFPGSGLPTESPPCRTPRAPVSHDHHVHVPQRVRPVRGVAPLRPPMPLRLARPEQRRQYPDSD